MEAGEVPTRRRRRSMLLAIVVWVVWWRLHLRVRERKGQPRRLLVVVRHCGRSAARVEEGARSSAHRVARVIFVGQRRRDGLQRMKWATADAASGLPLLRVVGVELRRSRLRAAAVERGQNQRPRSAAHVTDASRRSMVDPARSSAGGSRCQGKQGDQQRTARPRACMPLRKPTLYYLRLDSRCTALCCIIVHSF